MICKKINPGFEKNRFFLLIEVKADAVLTPSSSYGPGSSGDPDPLQGEKVGFGIIGDFRQRTGPG